MRFSCCSFQWTVNIDVIFSVLIKDSFALSHNAVLFGINAITILKISENSVPFLFTTIKELKIETL